MFPNYNRLWLKSPNEQCKCHKAPFLFCLIVRSVWQKPKGQAIGPVHQFRIKHLPRKPQFHPWGVCHIHISPTCAFHYGFSAFKCWHHWNSSNTSLHREIEQTVLNWGSCVVVCSVQEQPTSCSMALNAMSVLTKPGVAIVMPMEQPSSIQSQRSSWLLPCSPDHTIQQIHNVKGHHLYLYIWYTELIWKITKAIKLMILVLQRLLQRPFWRGFEI